MSNREAAPQDRKCGLRRTREDGAYMGLIGSVDIVREPASVSWRGTGCG
jgi:hypothetical protein